MIFDSMYLNENEIDFLSHVFDFQEDYGKIFYFCITMKSGAIHEVVYETEKEAKLYQRQILKRLSILNPLRINK